jgi:hypothetical protein
MMEKRKTRSEEMLHHVAGRRPYRILHSARQMFIVPALLAVSLLAGHSARAFGPMQSAHSLAYSSAAAVSEYELGRVWARGLPERLFAGKSIYLANGNAIEASANTASLLNPPPGFGDANAAFMNIRFNPRNLSMVIANSGAVLVRLSTYINDARVDNMRADGASGPRIGSVSVHGIDLRGTMIRIERIR